MGGRRAGAPELDDESVIRALKALADRTRFRMVQEIARGGELSCGQVGECFEMAQPTISHHMKILIDAGLLVVRNEGKLHIVCVNAPLVRAIAELLPRRLAPRAKR